MNNSRMTRKFERLLFEGIPEQPETIWERDDNGMVLMRKSGRSLAAGDMNAMPGVTMGTYKYDLENGTVTYLPNSEGLKLLDKEISKE